MPFTEAQLVTQLDGKGSKRIINIKRYMPGPVVADVYAVGVLAPYAGRARWIQLTTSGTAAQAATQLQNALRA